jgi:hypothetical protein
MHCKNYYMWRLWTFLILQIGVLLSPVVSVKGIDWCFLAFDEAMACAILFEMTLNWGAIFFSVCFCSFCFYTFTSVVVISVIEYIHTGCPQNPNFFCYFVNHELIFPVGSYLWMFLPPSSNSPLWVLCVTSIFWRRRVFWGLAPTRST